jgi:probable rRNA maturation factor
VQPVPVPVPDAPSPPTSASPPIEVEVSDTQGHLAIDHRALADLVRRVLAGEGVGRASLSVALVDEATIHAVNRRHLDHDWPTDVISFRLSEPGEPVLSGELVVSAERAATLARRHGADPRAELALYVVHGLLHLCGYDDLTAPDVEAMRRREGEIMTREGLTSTFPLVGPCAVVGEVEADDRERESARCSD